jgi:TetR/AcrR family transcriptional regulator, transcriptional repressor for nem operon
MKVSKDTAATHRNAIITAAARLFRERGFGGVTVHEITKAAGLTHGAFYGHFQSKDDLAAQACAHAIAETLKSWKGIAHTNKKRALQSIISTYLSGCHRNNPGFGCIFATLGPELARLSGETRYAATQALPQHIEFLENFFKHRNKQVRRHKALATYASLIGAMVLSRAVEDKELTEEILRAVLAERHDIDKVEIYSAGANKFARDP